MEYGSVRLSRELESLEDLVRRGEEGRKLLSRKFEALQEQDDSRSPHVQHDDPELLSFAEHVGVSRGGAAALGAERNEHVAEFADDPTVDLQPGESGNRDVCRLPEDRFPPRGAEARED